MFQEVKTKKKSLREVLPPRHESSSPRGEVIPPPPTVVQPPIVSYRERSPRGWMWPVVIGLVLVLIATYAATVVFAKVTVVATANSYNLTVDETLNATKTGGELNFQILTLEPKVGERVVTATGTERVSRPATGVVVIYNNFDKNPLKLIASTRFQSKSGKIYRIRQAVTVPGMKTVAGKTEPGAAEATVYAEEPGTAYNSDPTDFTLPGLKGDERFGKVFARSKTAITGGLVGEIKKLSPEAEQQARAALRGELTKSLLAEAQAKIPTDYVLFNDLSLVDIKDLSDLSTSAGNNVTLKEQLTLQAVILPADQVTAKIVDSRVSGFTADELSIADFSTIKATLPTPPANSLSETDSLSIRLTGAARLVPKIDTEALAKTLAGSSKAEAVQKVGAVKGVQKYSLEYRPPWLGHVPADPSRIDIELGS